MPAAPVSAAVVEAPGSVTEMAEATPGAAAVPPVVTVSPETIPLKDHDPSPPDLRVAALEADPPAAPQPRQEPPPPARKLHLRIVRDSERCPKTACYKWHVMERRLKLPHPAELDLASLRLAPSIREAAENGRVELIVDAVEQHKTIHGRDRVIIVATNLAGVTPHDSPFAAIAASGP